MYDNPKPFPVCRVKCEKDPGWTSKKPYLCVIADDRFPKQITLKILYPYWEKTTVCSKELEDFYSWYDESGNIVSHYKDGHNDHDSVIDWFPINMVEDVPTIFKEMFDKAKEYANTPKEWD